MSSSSSSRLQSIMFNKEELCEQTQAMVFKLVRAGNADRLRILLDTLKGNLLKQVLSATEPREEGANPLIVAARAGHTRVVEVLLNKGADPHATGTVDFDGEVISRVPPLWAASAAGHIGVCKLLISHGVNVNQTTNTNSTPLRGACYDGHLHIVKYLVDNGADIEIANRHGHTALMIASYREKVDVVRYLLSIGAQINRTSVKGNTVLHDAAEAGNLDILKMLIEANAQINPDDYGVSPLLSAALCGHMDLFPTLFKYASNREKHDAWKLLGATLVDKRVDLGGGIQCWKRAFEPSIMEEGLTDNIGEQNDVQKRVYGGFREAKTLREVNELVGDPDAIRMQALIIRERILGDSHPDTHHYLRLRGAYYLDIGSWNRTWELWSYILQLEQFHHHPMSLATGSTFSAFYDALTIMIEELMIRPDRRQLNQHFNPTIEQVAIVLDRAVYEAERYLFSDEKSRKENSWAYEERGIQQELDNLMSLCLQFVHLVSRVNLVNVVQPNNLSKDNALLAQPHRHMLLPPAGRANAMGRSDGPSSAANYRSVANNNYSGSNGGSPNALCHHSSSSPALYRVSSSLYDQRKSMLELANGDQRPSYVITNTVPRICSQAYLTPELDQRPKIELDGLRPSCQHLKCLMFRMHSVFSKLGMNILHMACEERDGREEMEMPRIPSYFVVEKLLQIGANPTRADAFGNTPLHILLSNDLDKVSIMRLLLESGAPLHARNQRNETCFELIRRRPCTLKHLQLQLGRHLSLKQMAANMVKRKQLDLEGLPSELHKYLAIF